MPPYLEGKLLWATSPVRDLNGSRTVLELLFVFFTYMCRFFTVNDLLMEVTIIQKLLSENYVTTKFRGTIPVFHNSCLVIQNTNYFRSRIYPSSLLFASCFWDSGFLSTLDLLKKNLLNLLFLHICNRLGSKPIESIFLGSEVVVQYFDWHKRGWIPERQHILFPNTQKQNHLLVFILWKWNWFFQKKKHEIGIGW